MANNFTGLLITFLPHLVEQHQQVLSTLRSVTRSIFYALGTSCYVFSSYFLFALYIL